MMKRITVNSMQWITLIAVGLLAVQASAQESAVLKTKKDKDSYAVGVDLARNLKRRGVQLDTEALLRGMGDVVSSQKLQMTEDDLRQTLAALKAAAPYNSKQYKDGYAVGVDLARNLERRGVQMDSDALLRGMRDLISGQKLLMSEDDLDKTLHTLQIEEHERQIVAGGGLSPIADNNATKGAAFLAQNQTNQGVICLPSGLQYKILKAGTGPKPTASDTVQCYFRGSLIDGRQFAGSVPGGVPATFKLSGVIPGITEALQLMPVGSKWQIFIPPALGYGEKGAGRSKYGQKIGPNETLIYELELLAIK